MNAAGGLLLGLTAGGLSVYSLWLITGFTARAATGLTLPPEVERPSGWDAAAQDPDVVTSGQWLRIRQEAAVGREQTEGASTPSPTVPPSARASLQGEPSPDGALRHASLRVWFAFLLKAPLLFLVALGARSLGETALHWCVSGIVLVYCVAVLWAAGRTHRP